MLKNLKYFIINSQVKSLYREFIKLINKSENKNELLIMINNEFCIKTHDLDLIKYKLYEGKKQLKLLENNILISK